MIILKAGIFGGAGGGIFTNMVGDRTDIRYPVDSGEDARKRVAAAPILITEGLPWQYFGTAAAPAANRDDGRRLRRLDGS